MKKTTIRKFLKNAFKFILIFGICMMNLAAAIKVADYMGPQVTVVYEEIIAVEKTAFFAIGPDEAEDMAEYIAQWKSYGNVRVFDPTVVTNEKGEVIGWNVRTWTYPTDYRVKTETEVKKK